VINLCRSYEESLDNDSVDAWVNRNYQNEQHAVKLSENSALSTGDQNNENELLIETQTSSTYTTDDNEITVCTSKVDSTLTLQR
jgi:hypothetical protein